MVFRCLKDTLGILHTIACKLQVIMSDNTGCLSIDRLLNLNDHEYYLKKVNSKEILKVMVTEGALKVDLSARIMFLGNFVLLASNSSLEMLSMPSRYLSLPEENVSQRDEIQR